MPLPVGQIAVFMVIAVPYVLILSLIGLPFSHTLLWVYVLPPGVLAWLTTRPVLEGKRLPELILSQARYLLEPRTWCRMAPFAEKNEIVIVCRVWRRAELEPAAEFAVAVANVRYEDEAADAAGGTRRVRGRLAAGSAAGGAALGAAAEVVVDSGSAGLESAERGSSRRGRGGR